MHIDEQIFAILPAPSRAKLERLISERELAAAAMHAASDKLQDAIKTHVLLENQVRQQLDSFQGVEILPPQEVFRPSAVRQAKIDTETRLMAPVRAAERRKKAAEEAHERAVARWREYDFVGHCLEWLQGIASLGAPSFKHFTPPLPKVKDAVAEVQRIRRELESLDAAWRAAENAPLPPKTVRERAIAEIDRIAQAGALELNPYNRSGEPLDLERAITQRQTAVRVPGADHPDLILTGKGPGPLAVWLLRDQLVEKINALADALPVEGALDDDEREREFARIAEERLRLERLEEAFIVAMEAEGRFVPRRRNADPRAILEIAEV